ncbi:hypothetical protein SBRCBS47491_001549 [Sporothrix bragantina]|uniref:Major facilitator superfamily (MFS) profile domain-containing protein n=1 Tax=Sporothrix bragantina TaxID=671064 RepID=A0ABP0AZJ3_9PEZI
MSSLHAETREASTAPRAAVDIGAAADVGPVEEAAFEKQDLVNDDEALKYLNNHVIQVTPEEEKAVLRKIDWRVIPLLMAINCIQLIDKVTISTAATYGMITEANLVGQEYSLLVTMFYLGYIVAEYPSLYLMQRFPTGKYMTVNFVLWGVVLTCAGAATDFAGLATCRVLLGVFEAPLNAGMILVTASWWTKEEQPRRLGLWYSAIGFVNLFVVLIFYGVAHIQVGNMFPYQWVFIISGLVTVLFGISLWWLLPSSPMTCRFLNDREKTIAIQRVLHNQTGIKNAHQKRYQVVEALTDPKVWILVLCVFFHNMTNALQTSFTGLIIKGFGFTTYKTLLMTMPQSAIAAVCCLVVTWFLGSTYGQNTRILLCIVCYLPGVVGTALLYSIPVTSSTLSVHLFAIYFINTITTCASIIYSLMASNVGGYTKKSIANTMVFIGYSVANIVSPQTFLSREAPRYPTGVAVTLASFCAVILLLVVLYFLYVAENKRRDQEAAGTSPITDDERMRTAFHDFTDKENRMMRYAL